MSRCLAVVQNTGIKWRQDLAKIRGVPDPTIRNDVPAVEKNQNFTQDEILLQKKLKEVKKQARKAI